jgi:hypothetical protein
MIDDTAKKSVSVRAAPRWSIDWELPLSLLVMWLVFISIPLYLGGIGLGWDAMNHQIYLGWVADSSRFDKDYMAASLQSYQFPYLYWPVYKLAALGASGLTAGIVLSSLHLVTVPPVWMVTKALITGSDITSIAFRFAAVILAFMSAVPLKTLEATGNDLLAAAPLLWAIAIAFKAITDKHALPKRTFLGAALFSGLMGGLAVACKLSNGPLVLLLPWLFWFCQGAPLARLKWMGVNAIAIGVGFGVTYGYWGYQLWLQFGNPLYPFYDGYFESLRKMLEWQQ